MPFLRRFGEVTSAVFSGYFFSRFAALWCVRRRFARVLLAFGGSLLVFYWPFAALYLRLAAFLFAL